MSEYTLAGKTGTAQNSHGPDHGWFIGFAPAEKPEIVVGAIFEFGEHGSEVAPYVMQAARRYLLGPDAGTVGRPQPLDLPGDAPSAPLPSDSVPPGLLVPPVTRGT
jgi:membrane peptidoglycan carboxypeptidase